LDNLVVDHSAGLDVIQSFERQPVMLRSFVALNVFRCGHLGTFRTNL
jgi:hypothetical protein